MRLALHDGATALRTFYACVNQQRFGIAAVREPRAGQKLAIAPLLNHHQAATIFTGHIRNFFRQFHMANSLIRFFQSYRKGVIELF